MNEITIRPARPGDVRPALALAIRVFMIHSAPLYKRKAVRHFRKTCKDKEAVRSYEAGKAPMFIAWDGERLVGMAAASWRRADKISDLFVDPAYHRRGIATRLMDRLVAAMGASNVRLGSSPYAVPFYLKYGFAPTDKEQHKHGAIWQPMAYTPPIVIRPARPGDVRPALALAIRVFMEYQAPLYGPAQTENFRKHCIEDEALTEAYITQACAMFVALDGERIVGMIGEERNEEIILVFVDPAYQRKGIATRLMDAMIDTMAKRGASRIALNSSPFGKPFYLHYGFRPTGEEQNHDGHIFTPMAFDKGA